MITFQSIGLKQELVDAVTDLGFENPSPIQEQTIPLLINNKTDVIALAQTGTGKTAAFGLPLLHRLKGKFDAPQALILSPTRELCMQIREEIIKYSAHLDTQIVAVYGGASITEQIRALRKGAEVIVATPGRLIDLLERKAIKIDEVKTIVLDEADEMLNMGFREDIELILSKTSSRDEAWLFSATMNNDVRRIAKKFMNQPKEIAVAKENIGNENIDHQYYVTQGRYRYEALQRLLDFIPEIYGIIFTRTKQDAHDISEKLVKDGYTVSALHGDLDQKMRTKVMNKFKSKQLQVLVATDVAARGIDVNDITHVINYELPDDPEIYTHRSGRTARAGKSGICITIATSREISKIRRIEKIINSKFHKSDIPDGAEVIRKRLFHFLEKIENTVPQNEFGEVYNTAIHDKLDHLSKDDLINRLLWLQLKDTIETYQDAPELNAGFKDEVKESKKDKFALKQGSRLFVNIGRKEGITPKKLADFIADTIDFEYKLIDQIKITETSSFFNVPPDSIEYIVDNLSAQKYQGRKLRVELADSNPSGRGERRERKSSSGYKGESKQYKKNTPQSEGRRGTRKK